MGAFELGNNAKSANVVNKDIDCDSCNHDPKRLREECIIAFKVYDQCRQPDCKQLHH